MNNPENDQTAVLTAAQQGDDEALAQLIESFRSLLRKTALERLPAAVATRFSPADAVNKTWWAAFCSFPGFTGDIGGFRAWLCDIHDKTIIDAIRQQTAQKRTPNVEVPPSSHLRAARAPDTSPSERAIRNESHEQLADVLAQLSPIRREVVRLRFVEKCSMKEIGERINRSTKAAEALLSRSVRELRLKMQVGE